MLGFSLSLTAPRPRETTVPAHEQNGGGPKDSRCSPLLDSQSHHLDPQGRWPEPRQEPAALPSQAKRKEYTQEKSFQKGPQWRAWHLLIPSVPKATLLYPRASRLAPLCSTGPGTRHALCPNVGTALGALEVTSNAAACFLSPKVALVQEQMGDQGKVWGRAGPHTCLLGDVLPGDSGKGQGNYSWTWACWHCRALIPGDITDLGSLNQVPKGRLAFLTDPRRFEETLLLNSTLRLPSGLSLDQQGPLVLDARHLEILPKQASTRPVLQGLLNALLLVTC